VWNDRRLARRAARGDSDAFAAIFRRYQQDLYRYCVAILGDPQDAQDALQNTMVKALAALPGERRQIELKPWLYRVAHNESIELRRRARPTAPLDHAAPAPGAGLEQTAADRNRLRDLLADLGELPVRQRGALVMRELGGLNFEQIAAALDTSPGAARQVLYEARRSLQQMSDGREMTCDAVTALLSEHDGRVARRRDLRAHLRDCADCRRFAEDIRSRGETLAGIAPLGAIAAAGIAKGALAGSASMGTATGGGAATAGVSGAGSAAGGAAASGVAKLASTGAILKSAVAVVAVVGAGAVAVDHGHVFGGDGPSAPGSAHPAVVHDESSERASRPADGTASADHPGPRPPSAYMHPNGVVEVGLKAPSAVAAAHTPGAGGDRSATASSPGAGTSTGTDETTQRAHPEHPRHPTRPAHPQHPAHPAHPRHPAHPAHPARPTHATPQRDPSHPVVQSRPQHPSHPAHPSSPAKSTGRSPGTTAESGGAGESVPTPPAHPEKPPHPATAEAGSTVTEAVTPTEGAPTISEPSVTTGTGPETAPGQARNEGATPEP
jgi:RNA polymerase sigma factor (sigma-70 family)